MLAERQRVYDLEDLEGALHEVCRRYHVYPTDNHLADVGKCVDVLLEREPALRERVVELRRPLSRKMASPNPVASPAERRVRQHAAQAEARELKYDAVYVCAEAIACLQRLAAWPNLGHDSMLGHDDDAPKTSAVRVRR